MTYGHAQHRFFLEVAATQSIRKTDNPPAKHHRSPLDVVIIPNKTFGGVAINFHFYQMTNRGIKPQAFDTYTYPHIAEP